MSLSSVWNTVYPVIIAILFFELIIIVHEGGHFAAARLMKIKVNEFSIGMGPKIFFFHKRRNQIFFALDSFWRLLLYGR